MISRVPLLPVFFTGIWVTLLFLSTSSFALSTADTKATVNWDSLSIQTIAGTLVDRVEVASTGIRADTSNEDIDYEGTTLHEIGEVSNSITNASSTAKADASTLFTHANAVADGVTTVNVGAIADLHRTTDFSINMAGTFTFSLGYEVVNFFETTLQDEDNYGGSRIALFFAYRDDDNNNAYTVVGEEEIFEFNQLGTFSDTLSITRALGLEDYSFEAHIYSSVGASSPQQQAPVPEPSTIFLLGAGLAGLAFYRRNRK